MKKSLHSISVKVFQNYIFSLVRRGQKEVVLLSLNTDLKSIKEFKVFKGSSGSILKIYEKGLLICIDDKLFLVNGGKSELILRASRPINTFRSLTEAKDIVYIQEYGESPTGIYASEDLWNWRLLVTNKDIDKSSRHFHNIAYDPYRNWLIATLGDACLTRVIFSENLGRSWKPLYKGPWQFLPILILRDKIVFGMDSSIAKGGLGIYYPKNNKWDFIFLKWMDRKVKLSQMHQLKLLDDHIYVASLRIPKAIIISKDLKIWYRLSIDEFDNRINPEIDIGKDFIACSTGKSLIIFEKSELWKIMANEHVMMPYKAYLDRLKGYAFIMKRLLCRSETLSSIKS